MSAYEKIKDLKISIITKYSEYKPISNKVKIYQIHKLKPYKPDTLYFILKSILAIIKIHKNDPIDLINIHTHDSTIISPFLIKLVFKIPILMKIPTEYTTYIKQFELLEQHKSIEKIINYSWFKFFKSFILNKLDYIRPINEKMYQDLIDLKYPQQKILKIPNGIDSKNYLGLKKYDHNGTYFGFVGRLTEIKNLNYLLDEFKHFFSKFPGDKFFIYGEGPEQGKINTFIEQHSLENNIILKGYVKDKKKIYSNIDVLINSSFGEGISNVILEAMSTKTLVIASNVEGNKDLIIHKETGLLFNPYKKKALLNQLNYFKKNDDLVQQIIKNAENEIILNYDIEVIALKIYKFIKSNLSSHK